MYWKAHLQLIPLLRERKFKTKFKRSSTPIFKETFHIHQEISKHALKQLVVRYKVYGKAGLCGKKKIAGETEVNLGCVTAAQRNTLNDWRVLKRKSVQTEKMESLV